jgi:hypothetical protein
MFIKSFYYAISEEKILVYSAVVYGLASILSSFIFLKIYKLSLIGIAYSLNISVIIHLIFNIIYDIVYPTIRNYLWTPNKNVI